MEKIKKGYGLVFGVGSTRKEVIVQVGTTLYKLTAFAELDRTNLKEDMDLMFKKYHPMLLKESD